jgi:peptide-methionine (R)-S-oxide reductase
VRRLRQQALLLRRQVRLRHGWPSFDEALPSAVETHTDTSQGMVRTEITRALRLAPRPRLRGPTESGKRFCINSVCLKLDEKD